MRAEDTPGASSKGQETMTLTSGVARELARLRAAHYSNVRYALDVRLDSGAEMLQGTLEIRVALDEAAGDLVLDWRTATAADDGKPRARAWDIHVNGRKAQDAEVRHANEHLVISRSLLVRGENVLRMSFESPVSTTGAAAVTRYRDREDGAEYFYTLFVPSDASTAFPCFDQPDLKARFRLSVTAPKSWTVVSNTNAEGPEDTGATTKRVRFQETQPISTYVFAFAAGEFAEFRDEASALGTRLYVRKSQAERARKELPEVFRLTREGLAFFARYFDSKFPFPKYDLVIIPEFPFRGMEHAGATFLREETIIFPSDPTANDIWSRADVMLHEAAHQWFGDYVTMRWFDDLWLKEGFATFMASKAVEALLPQFNAWKVFYQRTKPLAYDTDATKGTTPIWQEIANLSAAKSAYGNIVYRKAPSMLRQAEFYLGADNFQRAVQMLVKEHAYANTEWADLVKAFERTSGQKLDAWAEAWVKRRGMADVRVEWTADARGRIKNLTLRQQDVLGEGGAWPMRLKLLLAYGADAAGKRRAPETLTVKLDGARETRVAEASGRARPQFVFANYEDYGYGRFLLDDASRASVLRNLGAIEDDFLRALLWGSLWDSVREAELAPLAYVELAIKHVARERDEVTAQAVLSRVETAFNRYLSGEQQREIAPRLEALLSERMMNAETVGLRITHFRAYKQMATTVGAHAHLREIFDGKSSIPGMTLRPRDRIEIVAAYLAKHGADDDAYIKVYEGWLSKQNSTDDERRYAFAAGASRNAATTKKRYFDAYLGDKELAESWIEASLVPFNAPRQAALTLPYLAPALRELPALKRTRKIFFVNGWLAAFIGGQCSDDALKVVRDFLARETALDRDLRLKVLEASDGLERCVRIRAKFGVKSKV
ncbi:MAG TPA: M1 family aminopeptidase [Pyrinomonadaceae bacterium]|nr:M1 family aminopeptidase [Pyrinomonadaceae bacterium]